MGTIRVLLADDHPYLRAGIRAHLATLPDLVVVGEAADGVAALRLAQELLPDVLVLDVELPGLSGVEVARRLRAAGSPVRVLALSAHDAAGYVEGLLQSGAAGYLLKDDAAIDLAQAIRGIAAGEQGWCSRRVVERLAQRQPPRRLPLSAREQHVLRLVAHGRRNDQIARELGIAPKTVENHVSSILTKLGLHNRGDAVAWAWGQGLVDAVGDLVLKQCVQ
jgi:DNA-binding NarL/FixJ family response regulator